MIQNQNPNVFDWYIWWSSKKYSKKCLVSIKITPASHSVGILAIQKVTISGKDFSVALRNGAICQNLTVYSTTIQILLFHSDEGRIFCYSKMIF